MVPADAPTIVARIQLGWQVQRTRPGQPQKHLDKNPNLVWKWNEAFMFVAGEPFDEPLVVTVEAEAEAGCKPVPVGRVIISIPVNNDLAKSSVDELTHYSGDLQPSAKQLRRSTVGILELGILSARFYKGGRQRLADPYCVAKYGAKWVRTRTALNTLAPQWNEQHTWEVFDPCTIVTVAAFDDRHVVLGSGSGESNKVVDQPMGKVRVRLSTLEVGRVYTHLLYPLMTLGAGGLNKTGELHLALRFTCTGWADMLGLYAEPLLPKMHHSHPIPVQQLDYLRLQATLMVAAPLRWKVVRYMYKHMPEDDVEDMFSLRLSMANLYRITSLLSGAVAVARCMDGIRKWKKPLATILVHPLWVLLVCCPRLILPTLFLCLFSIGVRNYRRRPRMDTELSLAEPGLVHPDELDEEFDTFPSTRPSGDVVRMRYDRLRTVAVRVQAVLVDLATQGGRALGLLSWRDPRATATFTMLCLVLAVVLYVTPFKVVALVLGFYLLRHPRLRSNQPSLFINFYKRLPAEPDMLL